MPADWLMGLANSFSSPERERERFSFPHCYLPPGRARCFKEKREGGGGEGERDANILTVHSSHGQMFQTKYSVWTDDGLNYLTEREIIRFSIANKILQFRIP